MIPAVAFSLAGVGACALVTGGGCLRDWQASRRRDDAAAFADRLGILAGSALIAAAIAVVLADAMLATALAAGQGRPW